MRIGVVIARYARSGGLERVAGEWARGLAARGHDVTVFAQTVERGAGDDAVRFAPVGGVRSPIAARAATFPLAATRAVRARALDVVITFGCTALVPAVVRLPGAHRPWWDLANARDAWTTPAGLRRRLNPHHPITLAFERRVVGAPLALRVLAATEDAAADIRTAYPRASARVDVVPDGVDLEAFTFDAGARAAARAGWEAEDRWVVLTIATEIRRKNIPALVRAFRGVQAARPDALLVVAGTAPREEIAALAAAEGLADAVRVPGFVPDLRAAYCGADVLAFPTVFDPWGLPVVEALACGTPVAASRAAGAASAVRDGETGALIADPSDIDGIARAIRRAGEIDATRDALHDSVAHLAWPRVVDAVERIATEAAP